MYLEKKSTRQLGICFSVVVEKDIVFYLHKLGICFSVVVEKIWFFIYHITCKSAT